MTQYLSEKGFSYYCNKETHARADSGGDKGREIRITMLESSLFAVRLDGGDVRARSSYQVVIRTEGPLLFWDLYSF